MTQDLNKVEKNERLNSIVFRIAGKETHIPAEHAEEIHELLGQWLEENE